ncbi:hypothetical protein PRIC1_004416 [Phytophthora ramorum]
MAKTDSNGAPTGSSIVKLQVKAKGKRRSVISPAFSRESKYLVKAPLPKKKLNKWQIFQVVRRLLVIAAAIQYINISLMATWRTVEVLRAMPNPTESFGISTSSLIADYMGDGLVGDSPLVQDVLGGDTTPRDYAVFLESAFKTSTENCSAVSQFDSAVYNHAFLSHGYLEMVSDTNYNNNTLSNFELVVVVVDCTFTPLVSGDPSAVRIYNLVRLRDDPSDLYLVMVSLSVQDYEIRAHQKYGPALLGILTVVHDMQVGVSEHFYAVAPTYPFQRSLEFQIYEFVELTDDSYLKLRSVPQNPLTQPVKILVTTRKRGFFDADDQSNICYMYPLLDAVDAKLALSRWEWFGEPVITDTWAWVHGLHFVFGVQTIFSLVILFLVSFQNARIGKIWIGDPFASVSTATLVTRGILVLLSWYLNSFWTIFELAMSNAAKLSGHEIVHVHVELVHADVLVVYFGLVGLLSSAVRERIDPAVAIFVFEIIHMYRLSLLRASSAVLNEVISYSDTVFQLGDADVTLDVDSMSPLRFWSAFQIPQKDGTFLAATFFPRIILLATITFYAILRKVYWHYHPEEVRQRSSQSKNQSANEKADVSLKSQLTNFEISTGAELQARFGIISDYKNYVYFKGMKFASADGVYCSGHVILNGKYLISSKDLLAIIMIKMVRARFTNVYVYEVDGNTVKDTARLVYPGTFSWSDLWHLNVTVLL